MSRESLVLLLGLVVLFVPSLGVPELWKEYVLLATGVLLLILGYLLRRSAYMRKIDRGNGESGTDSFVESRPQLNEESVNEETDIV